MELGWPLPKRKELIGRLKRQPETRSYPLFFQGQRQELARHRVPIELPKYRLDNGRTRSAQVEWLASHAELPKEFFSADLENEAAQRAQHQILTNMLGHGEKELLRYFKKHQQTDPLILTELGFVLNGNRRLCAMRNLIEDDSTTHGPVFGNIEVVFLPPADDRDLDRLEARLQITEEIKEEYSWTAKAFMLRTRRDEHGFDEKELSSLYEMTISEIRELLDMLSLAEAYLEDRGKPKQFKLIDKSQFAFRQLTKNRESFKTEADKELFTRVAYCLIDEPSQGRLYATIPDAAKHLQPIAASIRSDLAPDSAPKQSNAASILGVKTVSIDPILEVLQDEKRFDSVREIVSDVIESERFKAKEHKKGTKVSAALDKASELISSALRSWNTAQSKKKIANQVKVLETLVKTLRAKVNGDSKN